MTAWLFMDTSVRPSAAPIATRPANNIAGTDARATSGSRADSTSDVATVIVRLPNRSTRAPENTLATSPPTPAPTSVTPRPVSDTPRRSRISGSRGTHEENVAPLTKNAVAMAMVAERGIVGLASAGMAPRWSPPITIYHNPRCSKSRAALAIAEASDVDVTVVRYLDEPPDRDTLRRIVDRLDDDVSSLVRRDRWGELGVTAADVSTPDGVVATLIDHPVLMERPLIDTGDRAFIGRPTERVQDFFDAGPPFDSAG